MADQKASAPAKGMGLNHSASMYRDLPFNKLRDQAFEIIIGANQEPMQLDALIATLNALVASYLPENNSLLKCQSHNQAFAYVLNGFTKTLRDYQPFEGKKPAVLTYSCRKQLKSKLEGYANEIARMSKGALWLLPTAFIEPDAQSILEMQIRHNRILDKLNKQYPAFKDKNPVQLEEAITQLEKARANTQDNYSGLSILALTGVSSASIFAGFNTARHHTQAAIISFSADFAFLLLLILAVYKMKELGKDVTAKQLEEHIVAHPEEKSLSADNTKGT